MGYLEILAPIINCVLPKHQTKAGNAQQHPTLNGSRILHDWDISGPAVTRMLPEEAALVLMISSPATLLLSPSLQLYPFGSSVWSFGRWRRCSSLVYRWFLMIHKDDPKARRYGTLSPLWDTAEENWPKNILLVYRNLGSLLGGSLFLEIEMARCRVIYWVLGYEQWFSYPANLEPTWLANGDRTGKEVCG